MPAKAAKSTPSASLGFQPAQSLFANYQPPKDKGYITQEFQDFGYRLGLALNDLSHKSLYIKLAKTVDRGVLEQALSFVTDAQAQSKAKLFMWKVQQLRQKTAAASAASKEVSKTSPITDEPLSLPL